MKRLAILFTATALSACSSPGGPPKAAADASLHSRMLVLDTHLDTPLHFDRQGWNFADRHALATDLSQLDIPRMKDGNLDGGFFAIYTDQGPLTAEGYAAALAHARKRSDAIDRMIADNGSVIGAARTAEDARRLTREGRLIAFKSIENSYPLGEDLSLLQEFYDKGVRLAGQCTGRTTSSPTVPPTSRAGTGSVRSESNGSPR
jgi:Zn-dependent dipeptidase, microsomal dipeptidase homolog